VGDGRNFLTQRRDRFDVIVSQPSNPWITGVSNLFTREYFRAIRGRLTDDGLFCQWAQLYEMSPWNIKTIYRTLREEFPHVMVFAAEDLSSDTILIASNRPVVLDRARIERLLANPQTRAEAARAGFHSVHDILAQLLLGPEEVEAFTAGAPVNTDDNALIEFSAPRDLLGHGRHEPYLAKVYGPFWPYGHLHHLVAGYDGPDAAAARAALARSLLAHGKPREFRHWLAKSQAAGGGPGTEHARLLFQLVDTREDRDPEVPLAGSADLQPPTLPAGTAAEMAERITREYAQVMAHFRAQRYATAYKLIDAWPPRLLASAGVDTRLLAGFLRYKTQFFSDAIEELRPLADDPAVVARRPAVLYYLGRAYYANATYGKAVATLERFVELVKSQPALGVPLLPASAR
jgi:hypothetical protein